MVSATRRNSSRNRPSLSSNKHRIAVNVLSQPAPSELLYLADDTRDQAAHEGWTIAF
jgi:hypothetical protein